MRSTPEIIDVDGCVSYNTGPVEYKRLWSAVMLRALDDLANLVKSHKNLDAPAVTRSESYYWVLIDDGLQPGGFKWICSIMGWHPEETRAIIKRNWQNMLQRGWRSQRAIAGNTTVTEASDDDE